MARSRQAGFTLIELLVAMALLGFMMLIVWSTTSGAIFAHRSVGKNQERDHEIRVSLNRIVRDLSSAYLSANEQASGLEPRTRLVGKDQGDIHELVFSSMAHTVLWGDANESEQTVISYLPEADPDNRSTTNVVRHELRRPPNDTRQKEVPEIDILVRDVKKLSFEYYDWREKTWQTTWDTSQADGERGRLPSRIRVTLEIDEAGEDGRKRTVKYQTQARLMLQEELKFFTN